VNTSEEQANLQARKDELLKEDEGDDKSKAIPIPEPKPIPDLHQRLVAACQKYVELNPEGDRIVDVKYTMARTNYDFDHHEEAVKIFKDIAYSHPEHRLAVIAANLHLDSLNLLKKYDELQVEVVSYLEKRPIKDEAFIADISALNASIRFKKCNVFDEQEKWKDAAQCFVDFYRDFPESELVDKALYNAALDFERMKELGKAIQVRIFLLKERPNSELAPKSLYNVGGNYHALAVYTEAAKFYELYVDTYPKLENAEVALANASTFRQGLGELDKAIANYRKYLRFTNKLPSCLSNRSKRRKPSTSTKAI
jgi:tetratricopeptide (TPR) repeat protein